MTWKQIRNYYYHKVVVPLLPMLVAIVMALVDVLLVILMKGNFFYAAGIAIVIFGLYIWAVPKLVRKSVEFQTTDSFVKLTTFPRD